jgi:imidazolonepropionase-like amidohydrolase
MRSILLRMTGLGTAVLLAAGAARAETMVIRAAPMIDVVAGTEIGNPVVVATDGRITLVASGAAVKLPADARVIDLPGLIDLHVHLTSDPTISGYRGLEYVDSFAVALSVRHAAITLDAGFTTVRNVGSNNLEDIGLKQAIDGGGHCDAAELPPSVMTPTPGVVDGPDAIRAKVRQLRKWGAAVIKFCGTGRVFSKTDSVGGQQYSEAEIYALVAEAHMLGMKVAVHAHGTAGINAALRAGTDTIEDASLVDAERFALAKKHGCWFATDIYDNDYILFDGEKTGVFPESSEKERQIGRKQRETFRAAVTAGVKMLFATNAGVYPHGDDARLFARMTEWGMTPMQAIQAATLNAGEAPGRAHDVGAIEVGRYADIIAVATDPLTDIKALQNVAVVIKGGAIAMDNR